MDRYLDQTIASRTEASLNVLLVDDLCLLREGLSLLLSSTPSVTVTGTSDSVEGAIELLNHGCAVDVVLLDTKLRGESVIDKLQTLKAAAPKAGLVVITSRLDEIAHAHAIANGVSGIVLKDDPPDVLIKAIRGAANGEVWMSRSTMAKVLERMAPHTGHQTGGQDRIRSLTPRERDVIRCLSSGATNRVIGQRLGVSEKSVRNALSNIFSKLAVHNRLELMLFATTHELHRSAEPQ